MKRFPYLAAATFAFLAIAQARAAGKPNIIFILTDDLGFGDVGVFFQNQRREKNDRAEPWHFTPQLDRFAAEGIQLRQHYCPAPVCAPSRASLMLGVHQGHANVRDNQFDKALENNHTLASVLRGAGYATAAFGKWGLQGGPAEKGSAAKTAGPADWPAFPTRRGFDYYFGYIRHVDGHWHYPKEDGRQVWDNERQVSADLDCCYTTDLFTARAKKWISDQHAAHADQPFFIYLAYDTPHAKLQLPPTPFPAGSGAEGGLQWLGQPGKMLNTADGKPDGYMHPDYANATWDNDHDAATPEQPWPDVYKRYATDVRRIDDCVGDLLQLLRDLKIDRETLVVFTSDNGPSKESYLPENYAPNFFDSFGPMDGIKRDCWEGGIRVGALVRWPAHVPAGRISEMPNQSQDWMATFAEMAQVPAPARADGVSLLPTLTGEGTQKPSTVYVEYQNGDKTPPYPEFEKPRRGHVRKQMQAIRIGDFTGVRYNVLSHSDPFEIYDVAHDPKETRNVASERADLQQQMHDQVLRMRRPNESAPRPYDSEFVPALAVANPAPGLEWQAFAQPTPWLARLDDLTPSSSGTAPAIDLANAPRVGEFSMFFRGYIEVPADGEYTFHVATDTGALLRIHDATVLDWERAFGEGVEMNGTIRLQKGRHPFRLYYDHRGTEKPALTLTWNATGASPVAVPESAFSHGAK